MKISKQSRRDGKSLFNACRVDGVLDDARVRQAVDAVVKSKPRGHLGTLAHFHRLVKLDIARRTAVVEGAVALEPGFQAEVRSSLAKRYGPGLDVRFTVNPALIGGLRIKVGSDVLDGSVAHRLQSLADSI